MIVVGEAPSLLRPDLIGGVRVDAGCVCTEGKIDRLYLAGNQFVNTMTQLPVVASVAAA